MVAQIELVRFLHQNKKWLQNLQKIAEISVEDEIIEIRGIKGFHFTSIIPICLDIEEKNAHFLGLLFGDSCSTKQTSAQFGVSNTNFTLLKEARIQIEDKFLQPQAKIHVRVKVNSELNEEKLLEIAKMFRVRTQNVSQTINSSCKQINFELFVNNRPLKRVIFEEIFPQIDLILEKEALLPFLAGVLDADGNLRKDFIAITVGSLKEKEVIERIIEKIFQIKPHITPRKGKKALDIRIFGVNVVHKILLDIVPFLRTNKGLDILA